MEFYPYLTNYIPFGKMQGKNVLEIGLGYGTISQLMMKGRAAYHALDIAEGPVSMSLHRAALLDKIIVAKVGSAMSIPFEEGYFDFVVSIGCLHHTGDLEKSIQEVHRVLKKNGVAIIMVYNALSYRQLRDNFLSFCLRTMSDPKTIDSSSTEERRAQFDVNSSGEAAPETVFVKKSELRYLLRSFNNKSIVAENIGNEWFFENWNRNIALFFGKFVGIDLYITAKK